jgi:hypothetical protein
VLAPSNLGTLKASVNKRQLNTVIERPKKLLLEKVIFSVMNFSNYNNWAAELGM